MSRWKGGEKLPRNYHENTLKRSFLLTTPHHADGSPGKNDDRLDRHEAIIRGAGEPEQPLSGVGRRTEFVRNSRWRPYVLAAAGRADVGPDRVVVTKDHLADLSPERGRKHGNRKGHQDRAGERRDAK